MAKLEVNGREVYIRRTSFTGYTKQSKFKAKGIIVRQFEIIPFKFYFELINYEGRGGSRSWCFCDNCKKQTDFSIRTSITTPIVSKFIETGKATKNLDKEWNKNPTTYKFIVDRDFVNPFMPTINLAKVDKRMEYKNRPNPVFKKDKKEHWESNPREILDRKEYQITIEGYMMFPYITGDNYQIIEWSVHNGGGTATYAKFPVKVLPSNKKVKQIDIEPKVLKDV